MSIVQKINSGFDVNGERLSARCFELESLCRAADSITPTTPSDQVRALLNRWFADAALDIHTTVGGDVFGTLPGRDCSAQPVMIGSQIELHGRMLTVGDGLGLLIGLEVLQAIRDRGEVPVRSIAIAAFFQEAAVPSQASGKTAAISSTPVHPASHSAWRPIPLPYVPEERSLGAIIDLDASGAEIQIGQGPIFWQDGRPLIVVRGMQGCRRLKVSVLGQASHAGATPMNTRRDALIAAAELTLNLTNRSKTHGIPTVATIGTFDVIDGSIDKVADHVQFTVDIRDLDDRMLDRVEIDFKQAASHIECKHGVTIDIRLESMQPAEQFADASVDRACGIARRMGFLRDWSGSEISHDTHQRSNVRSTTMICAASAASSHENRSSGESVISAANLLGAYLYGLATAC